MISALNSVIAQSFLQDLTSCIPQLNTDMTALHIRKNVAQLLVRTASAVENANVKGIGEKLSEYRIRAAALMMPNDVAFVITSKENVK